MVPRLYFYQDEKGNNQRYLYCSRCPAGPFKTEEKNKSYIEGGFSGSVIYCRSCARELRMKPVDLHGKPIELEELIIKALSEASPLDKNIQEIEEPKTKAIPERRLQNLDRREIEKTEESRKVSGVDRNKYVKALQQELSGRRAIPFGGGYAIYLGQCSDNSFVCGVTTNIKKEAVRLNNGGGPKNERLPVEIVYYRTERSKDSAALVKEVLTKYKREQKEKLAKVFGNQFFKN